MIGCVSCSQSYIMSARTRIILVLTGLLLVGILLYLLRTVLWPVFLALILAYIFDPLIDKFEKRHIPRSLAIFMCVAAVVAGLGILILLIAPSVQKELVNLTRNLPEYAVQLKDKAFPWVEETLGAELPASLKGLMETASGTVSKLPPEMIKPFASFIGKLLGNTATFLLSVLTLVLIPIFTFYFLRDFDMFRQKIADLIPLPYREWTIDQLRQVDRVLSAFIRGQLSVCTILAILYSVGLWIVGIDLALIIGVSAGYLFIVPYLGTVVGLLAATIMALLEYRDLLHVLLAWTVFGVVQILEGYLFTPKIVGGKVGLSPVAVIISLLVGGGLFGILGILIAVPAAAVLKIFSHEFIRLYKSSPVFTGKNRLSEDMEEKEG